MSRLVILLVALTAMLAGCATEPAAPEGTTTPNTTTPNTTTPGTTAGGSAEKCDLTASAPAGPTARAGAAPSEDEAKAILTQAFAAMPSEFAAKLWGDEEGSTVMTMAMSVRGSSMYMLMCASPEALGDEADQFADHLMNGIGMWANDNGAIFLMGDVAIAMSGEESAANENPFKEFGSPDSMFAAPDDVTVSNISAVTYRGKNAVQMDVAGADDDGEMVALKVVVITDGTPKLARMEGENFGSSGSDNDPLSDAYVVLELYEAGAIELPIPEAATRALELAYKSDAQFAFFGGSSQEEGEDYTETWTFSGSGTVPVGEVSVHIKEGAADPSDFSSSSKQATVWKMLLSESTKTEGTLTLTFDDKDASGTVSKGDTLSIVDTSGERPNLVLFDEKTKTNIVPGIGLWVLVGVAALVAFARRR